MDHGTRSSKSGGEISPLTAGAVLVIVLRAQENINICACGDDCNDTYVCVSYDTNLRTSTHIADQAADAAG